MDRKINIRWVKMRMKNLNMRLYYIPDFRENDYYCRDKKISGQMGTRQQKEARMQRKLKPFTMVVPLALLFLISARCVNQGRSSQAEYFYRDDNRSLLWEISGNGLKEPSYLYGTIHIQRKEVFAYDDVVRSVFDSCRAYAMELKMDEINPKELKELTYLTVPLDSLLPENKYHKLDSLLQKRSGMSITAFRHTKPFFIYSMLIKEEIGSDTKIPLDFDFYSKAQNAGKKLYGIEKLTEQLEAVNSLTIEQQADMVIEGFMDTTKAIEGEMDKMIRLYTSQDLPALMEMILETEKQMPGFSEAFLVKRNKRMADRIEEFCKKRMTFNAIGAAHLWGDTGVIELLKKKGYTVKPIQFTFKKT